MVIESFAANYPIIFHSIIIIASLAVIIKAAELALVGIIEYAKKFGISDVLIGLIIISLGASMPELVSAITGALKADSGIVLGTILGSNLTGLTLVIGISAIVAGKLKLDPKVLKETELITLFAVALPFFLIIDGVLSRIDAGILITGFVAYIVYVGMKEGKAGKLKKDVKIGKIYVSGLVFVLALLAIMLSARWLVFSSQEIASLLNISSYLVALIVIGIGTSLPDLIVGVRSLLQGHKEIGIGNSLGSVVVKSLLFLGILAFINPISISVSTILLAEIFLLLSLTFMLYLTMKGSMNWKHGILLLLLYVVFVIITILMQGGA